MNDKTLPVKQKDLTRIMEGMRRDGFFRRWLFAGTDESSSYVLLRPEDIKDIADKVSEMLMAGTLPKEAVIGYEAKTVARNAVVDPLFDTVKPGDEVEFFIAGKKIGRRVYRCIPNV